MKSDLLPPVPVPSARRWQYFRFRHFPLASASLAVAAAIRLWVVNLPEGVPPVQSETAANSTATAEVDQIRDRPLSTNITAAEILTASLRGDRADTKVLAGND